MRGLLAWLIDHSDAEHTVQSMAARQYMSWRPFARKVNDESGTTSH